MELPFLNPALLAALPAAGIPVLIHLLNRRRSITIEWGAMELLRRVMIFRSRQIRLEDILLMLLRCAAILCVVLALAGPTTRWLSVAGTPDTGVVIAVDGSLSMTHRPGLASRFEGAVARVREILGTIEPGRPVTLVELGARPRVLVRNAGYEAARFENLLRELKPLAEPLRLEDGLAELAELVAEIKAPQKELYIVTDGQAANFGQPSDTTKAALSALSASARLFLVTVPCPSESNVAVTGLELAAGRLRVGAVVRFRATVRNCGTGVQDAGELSLLMDDQTVDKRFVGRLAPGQTMPVSLYATFNRFGAVRVTARLADDALAADDNRYAVVNVRSVMRVLCVDGEPMDRSDSGAASLVATALSLKTSDRSDSLTDVRQIPWTSLAGARLSDFDVVVLVNVADVAEEKAVELRRFVEQGGGLILVAGQNVKPEVFNRRFLAANSSLLPAELLPGEEKGVRSLLPERPEGGFAQKVPDPFSLAATGALLHLDMPDHPLVQPLRSLPKEILSDLVFYRYLNVRPTADGTTILRLAGGAPLLMERSVGLGKVLLWTSGADRAWSNMAVNPAFVILLQQSLTYLARQPFEVPVTAPAPIVSSFPGLAAGTDVRVTDPDGRHTTVQTFVRSGEVIVETSATTGAGFYDIQPGRTVAVNIDTVESDVRNLKAGELTALFGSSGVSVLPGDGSVAAAVIEARTGRELWRMLLVAALIALVGEGVLSRRLGRRGG